MCEFVPTPRACVSRGQPKAELLGAFSLVRFFGASKEMNEKKLFLSDYACGFAAYSARFSLAVKPIKRLGFSGSCISARMASKTTRN
jgi:hypothetical protein